jgi:hypothetical protein
MDQDQTKQAELNKEAEERISAFEFGMDLFFKDKGIEKKAFAEIVGITEEQVTEAGIACLEQQQTVEQNAQPAAASQK